MDKTLSIGMMTELECIKAFIELGYHCSIPYGDCARYDVIVDIDNKQYQLTIDSYDIKGKSTFYAKELQNNKSVNIIRLNKININIGNI